MAVRAASRGDRDAVLGFCRHTFAWGDYIAGAWDRWMAEGGLLVDDPGGGPVAVCHAYPVPGGRAMWIEGVRVSPGRRRRGHATRLVRRCEEIAAGSGCAAAQMAVEAGNAASARLAAGLGYGARGTWHMYHLAARAAGGGARRAFARRPAPPAPGSYYVDAWRWRPLTAAAARRLAAQGRVASSPGGSAVISPPASPGERAVATLAAASPRAARGLLDAVRSESLRRGAPGAAVLSAARLPGLRRRASFVLMEKGL